MYNFVLANKLDVLARGVVVVFLKVRYEHTFLCFYGEYECFRSPEVDLSGCSSMTFSTRGTNNRVENQGY
jgi:hypothetical protein